MARAEGPQRVRSAGESGGGPSAPPAAPGPGTAAAERRRGSGTALRWFISGALCAAFLGLGMSIAVLGPTFENLAANVGQNVSDIYYIFVGRSLGYLLGSVIGGVLFDCTDAHLLLALSMSATTLGLYGIPWCKRSLLLTALMSVIGASMGILDTGGNVLALNTWGSEAGPHMQALHFSFAVGACLAPLLAKMALGGSHPQDLPVAEKTNQSVLRSVPAAPAASATTALKHPLSEEFLWSYVVIGTYLVLVSVFFFALYCRGRSARDKAKPSVREDAFARYHSALIALLFVFFLCYVGAEVTYGSYIFTYAKVFAGMKDSEAAALNSVFWGTFAACRGLAIFCAAFLYPGTMIALSLVGSAASSLCLTFFAGYPALLWGGTAVYGASMATVFPSGISWIEQYTVVQGKAASLFVIGAALGEMCVPAAAGYLQGRFHHVPVVMYTALLTSAVTALLFPVMYKVANSPSESSSVGASDGEVRKALLSPSRLCEDENDEEDTAEWNEADSEVIEMSDTLRNPVTETSQRVPGGSPAQVALRPHSDDALRESPEAAGGSPEGAGVAVDQEISDDSKS